MKDFHRTCMYVLGGLLLTGAATRASADEWNKKTYVTISQSIEIPGAVLPPGKYVFKLLDSPSDRHIVVIMNAEENHVYTTNLAIPKYRMKPSDKSVFTFYEMPGGGAEPIRAWFYPGDTIGQEFAYPKHRAMEIALAMKQDVPILAESRQTEAAPATPAETPVPANPESTGSADRIAIEEPAPTPVPLPSVEPTTVPESAEAAAAEPSTPTDDTPPEPAMPKTAGDTAAFGLAGLCCIALAASLRLAGRRAAAKS